METFKFELGCLERIILNMILISRRPCAIMLNGQAFSNCVENS